VESDVALTCLLGMVESQKILRFLSCYPRLLTTTAWTLNVAGLRDSYGSAEGLVQMEVPDEHSLNAFAPLFAGEMSRWAKGENRSVRLAALALRLEYFKAEPIKITEGPMLEMERDRLRNEGDEAGAAAVDHVTVLTDGLRTLYASGDTDHAELVGKVIEIQPLPATEHIPAGMILTVEVLHEEHDAGTILPVYAFRPALGNYTPTLGDLVQGVVWLQVTLTEG